MAEEKKVTIMNRGSRHFQIGADRRIAPGELAVVTAAEAAKLVVYADLVDVSKLTAKNGNGSEKLVADNAKLAAENEALKKQLADDDGDKKKEKEKVA